MLIEAPVPSVLLPIIGRHSIRAFSPEEVPESALISLFEAAHLAPSSFNLQPWRFLVARQGEPAFATLAGCLTHANEWALQAPVLVLTMAHKFLPDGSLNHHASHDTGGAMAFLSLEAVYLGLQVHQMAGFDARRAHAEFAVPHDVEVVTVAALGYPGDQERLSERLRVAEMAPRQRHPLTSLVFAESFGAAPAWLVP
jgi:nitroreductase